MIDDKENSNEVLRGHVNIIILKALFESDKYGYEIGKYIESKSEGDYILKQPTLYSSLKRLESKKFIESYWGDDDNTNGGRRKYFKLTQMGKQIFTDNIDYWNQSKVIIDKIITGKKIPKEKTSSDDNIKNSDNTVINNGRIDNFKATPLLFEQKGQAYNMQFNNQQDNNRHNTNNNNSINKNNQQEEINIPKFTRSQQMFSQESGKDNEYKTILSKLLSNVKNETKDKDDIVENKDELLKQINLNNVDNLEKDILNSQSNNNFNNSSSLKNNKIDEFENRTVSKFNERPNDKSFSLLPSSSEYNYSGFNKLQNEMMEQGFKLRPYTDVKSSPKQYLLINKINMMSSVILYLFIVLQTALIFYFWEPLINIGIQYYIYIIAFFLLMPVTAAVNYAIKPLKKSKKRFFFVNNFISSLMMFIVCVLGITSIALLFNIDVNSYYELVLKMVVPIVYALNFIIYSIIWGLLYKNKRCYI